MKKLLLSAAAMMVAAAMYAVPAKPVKTTITLKDGSTREVTLRGDEFAHFFEAEDGTGYRKLKDGSFEEVDVDALLAKGRAKAQAVNSARRAKGARRKATWGAASNPISGSKKGLVILVNYADKSMTSAHTNSFYNRYFNEEGFSENGMGGSVHDYFYDCSYGQFDLTFDVVGPVTVSKGWEYYGENDSDGNDKHPGELVAEAVQLANKAGTDFSKYDWDNDGYVDQVYVIFAGNGEAQNADANTIWPHEYDLSSAHYFGDGPGAQYLDGVYVNTYAISNECRGSYSTVVDGIGTACHEFSHCMCIPDFYDVKKGQNFGMNFWDLLDAGCYAGASNSGETPIGYTCYERMYCGWLTPKELTEYTVVDSLKSLAKEPDAYIIYNKGNRNEYYMLQNVQRDGWFKYTRGRGMLILHVDFDKNIWASNSVNVTASRQRMTIIPADNNLGSSANSGDTWPGTSKNTELTNESTPAASVYNKNSDGQYLMNFPIRNIKEDTRAGIISFVAGDLVLDAPVAEEAVDVTTNGFTANWNSVTNASNYEVTLFARDTVTVDPTESVLITEDFSKFANGKTSDGLTDYGRAATLDNMMTTAGWTGYKVYDTPYAAARLGSASEAGYLTTPVLISTTGTVTAVVSCTKYKSDTGTLSIQDAPTATTVYSAITPVAEESTEYIKIGLSGDFQLTFATSGKRVYINGITLYDGDFSAEELAAKAPRKATKATVYVTTEPTYTFFDLDPAYTYSYRVRAGKENVYSEWSNTVDVILSGQGDEDAIADIKSDVYANDAIYDLSGRRVVSPSHGIYIINGKKVIK